MYYVIFIIILGLTLSGRKSIPYNVRRIFFDFIYSIITLMAIFRYGQGQDYFNYEAVFDSVSTIDKLADTELIFLTDIGFGIITQLAILCHIPFQVYSGILSLIAMLLFYKFLKEQCDYSFFSLLAFYSVIYLIYPTSALRQALSMGIFFAYMYPLLSRNRFISYYLLGLISVSIHISSFIYFFMPLLKKLANSKRQLIAIYFLSFFFLFFGPNMFSLINISFITERFLSYTDVSSSGNQILAILVRVFITAPLLFVSARKIQDEKLRESCSMMILGFFIYSMTSFSEIGSSRIWGFFLGFECIMLSKINYFNIHYTLRKKMLIYYTVILCVLWIKDINAIIGQGRYKNCDMFTYPYISVFEGDQVLTHYRTDKGFVEGSY